MVVRTDPAHYCFILSHIARIATMAAYVLPPEPCFQYCLCYVFNQHHLCNKYHYTLHVHFSTCYVHNRVYILQSKMLLVLVCLHRYVGFVGFMLFMILCNSCVMIFMIQPASTRYADVIDFIHLLKNK